MTQKQFHLQKFGNLLEGWDQQYRKNQEKAQIQTTYTYASYSPYADEKKKFKKIKFWKKEGHVKYNTEFKVYPDQAVFGESRKIFENITQKRSKLRDNDEISESDDIEHAVKKGIRKLQEQFIVRKMSKLIAMKEEKNQVKKTKKISKQQK